MPTSFYPLAALTYATSQSQIHSGLVIGRFNLLSAYLDLFFLLLLRKIPLSTYGVRGVFEHHATTDQSPKWYGASFVVGVMRAMESLDGIIVDG